MNAIYDRLIKSLFETSAVRICSEDKPFWYTSGKIGPYYINTHFLYGSEAAANKLLEMIDSSKSSPKELHEKVFPEILGNYQREPIFKNLIDDMVSFIKENIDLDKVRYISGGERRDWFFSFITAHFLGKPHITIFKDLSMALLEGGETKKVPALKGAEVLHIADLITEASSYERAWIPAIKSAGGKITCSLAVIDRMQGGGELLSKNGIKSYALANIDITLFDKALELGYISEGQYNLVKEYIKDPDESMKNFLKKHPEFIAESLAADPKTAERARLCLEKNFYK